jgi:hypothetical protein
VLSRFLALSAPGIMAREEFCYYFSIGHRGHSRYTVNIYSILPNVTGEFYFNADG